MEEIVKVVGYRRVEFKPNDGGLIEGYTIFYEMTPSKDDVTGVITGKQFVPDRCAYLPVLGDHIIFRYNKYGKIGSIEVV